MDLDLCQIKLQYTGKSRIKSTIIARDLVVQDPLDSETKTGNFLPLVHIG